MHTVLTELIKRYLPLIYGTGGEEGKERFFLKNQRTAFLVLWGFFNKSFGKKKWGQMFLGFGINV